MCKWKFIVGKRLIGFPPTGAFSLTLSHQIHLVQQVQHLIPCTYFIQEFCLQANEKHNIDH